MLRSFYFLCPFGLALLANAQIAVTPLGPAQAWKRAEFTITGVPHSANPFDPDQIRVDAAISLPGGKSITVPGFWYQNYTKALSNGREILTTNGPPEWRVRFVPTQPGAYQLIVHVRTNGAAAGSSAPLPFSAAETPTPAGYVSIAPGAQYFQTSSNSPLRLLGHNVCWHHARGTFDYQDWFNAMEKAGENFARLWMWPHAFGIESERNTLTRYRLDRAWQLDAVFDLAEEKGIYLLLCLDYHGMFEQTPDYWGGNNHWTNNPYHVINGGPCPNQNAFFTSTAAHALYQKRLHYLVARYGHSPNLLAWEFFNEIDNVYRYLQPADVVAWHDTMGRWFKTNDPFGHLVTTSLTGNSDRPELWALPSLDFSMYHSYNEPSPTTRFATVSQSFLSRYRKPVLIGEFGIDWRGWNRAGDPYLRGFRQGLWGGALGGSVGTAMSWWWENIHSENVYPLFTSLKNILNRTGWAQGDWSSMQFLTSGLPPAEVGQPLLETEPFNVLLQPSSAWGAKPSGKLAVTGPDSAAYSSTTLNAFVHGSAHADLRVPFRLSAWFTNQAQIVLHLNSVSQGAILTVRVDGTQVYRTNLPNLDGKWEVNNEFNLDLPVPLPEGKHLVEILNAGSDWFYLDSVKLENVLPSTYSGDWQPSPDAIGLHQPGEALLYVVAPGAAYPAGATNAVLPLQTNQFLRLTNWSAGEFIAEWFNPATGEPLSSTRSVTTNQLLTLPLPPFREDLVGIIFPPPALEAVPATHEGAFHIRLNSEPGGQYLLETSTNLSSWAPLHLITNTTGQSFVIYSGPTTDTQAFFRTRKPVN